MAENIMTEEIWGELPPVEGTTQVTRSMLEMLNPKPYVSETEPNHISIQAPETKQRKFPKCPYVSHSISLLSYISEVEKLIQEVSMTKNKHVIMPKLPEFEKLQIKTEEDHETDRKNNFEYGTNVQTVKALTRRGVATLALQYECEKSTNSALDFLTDLTMQWIETVTKSLRLIVDNEALTGRTGFYGAIDQLLHDYEIDGIREINHFFKQGVIGYHDNLVQQSKNVTAKLQALCSSTKQTLPDQPKPVVKQEEPTQSGWVSVQNTSGQSVSTVLAGTNLQPFVKTEPHNSVRTNWTPSPAQNEVVRGQELSAYMNTFRPISPTQDTYGPKKKKIRK